jgi:N-acetylmuramoyl-L-alanine amidase
VLGLKLPILRGGQSGRHLARRRDIVFGSAAVCLLVLLAGAGAVWAEETTTTSVAVAADTDTSTTETGISTPSIDLVSVVPVAYQQSDSRLLYLGAWSYRALAWASGGSFHYAGSSGAAVLVSFTGAAIELIACTGPQYGMALVRVDGGLAEYADFYSSAALYQQSVYGKQDLSMGPHTLTIEWVKEKNESSSGYLVSLDALKILGTSETPGSLVQAPAPTRYQQDDGHFKYMGVWGNSWTWSASGGSFSHVNAPGSAVNIAFNGTYLAWIAKKGPGYGKAWVSLDGGPASVVDLYSPYDKYKQRVYETGLLEAGPHTVSIYWIGKKNWAASGYRVDVDAFDVFGELTTAPDPAPIPWLYQQTDPRLTYLGAWSYRASAWASAGSFYFAGSRGAAVTVSFTGSAIELFATKGPEYGQALVSLDGGPAEYADFHSAAGVCVQSVYKKEGLENTAHTLTMEWAGVKNDAARGYLISLDALLITGTLAQAPKATTLQQADSHMAYEGRWLDCVAASASGGSFYYADSPGAAVTVKFDGSYLAWFAKTGPQYGKALVRLDDGPATEVDLYSANSLCRQCVYSARGVGLGSQTLTIEWAGAKNAASTGYLVSMDALCVVGSLCRLEPADLAAERPPFALVCGDKTRVTFALGGTPASVAAALTADGDLSVDCAGALPGCPSLPLSVGSTELRSVAELARSDPAGVVLTLDMGRYRRFRVMSLAASEACVDRIVVDVYRRTDGPPIDGPPLICLDPGHGGSSNHATGVVSGALEKNLDLAISQSAAAGLRESGLRVMLTRDSDIDVSLQARCDLANAAKASLFVSVHNNGFVDPTVGGTETFYMAKTASYTVAAVALAKAVQSHLVAALGFRDRGARTYYGGSLWVLSGTWMPAVLVEICFMSKPAEDAVISSPAGQQAAAKAIADAIREYLGWSTEVYSTLG